MRILVTGAAGFIGSNIAKRLAKSHEVVATDSFNNAIWSNLIGFDGDVVTVDLLGDIGVLQRLGPFDVISHQAAVTGVVETSDQQKIMLANVEGFRRILDLAVGWKSRVVWASSASIYGRNPSPNSESQPPDPLNVYAFSKMTGERLARSYQPKLAKPVIGLRYFNVYGPGEEHKGKLASMIYQLAKQMRAGKRPRIFTPGEQKRDFVYVEDVVNAHLKAMECATSGAFNVGSGVTFSFNQVVKRLNEVMGTNLAPEYFENPYSFTQDHTEADLTLSRKVLWYTPEFLPEKGIEAYFKSGKLGV